MAVPGGYKLLQDNILTTLADHLDPSMHPMVEPLPSCQLGLLLWDSALVLVVGAAGVAVREPLLLPGPPLAMSHAGLFVVVVGEEGVTVYDRNSAREVQVRGWG